MFKINNEIKIIYIYIEEKVQIFLINKKEEERYLTKKCDYNINNINAKNNNGNNKKRKL